MVVSTSVHFRSSDSENNQPKPTMSPLIVSNPRGDHCDPLFVYLRTSSSMTVDNVSARSCISGASAALLNHSPCR